MILESKPKIAEAIYKNAIKEIHAKGCKLLEIFVLSYSVACYAVSDKRSNKRRTEKLPRGQIGKLARNNHSQ